MNTRLLLRKKLQVIISNFKEELTLKEIRKPFDIPNIIVRDFYYSNFNILIIFPDISQQSNYWRTLIEFIKSKFSRGKRSISKIPGIEILSSYIAETGNRMLHVHIE